MGVGGEGGLGVRMGGVPVQTGTSKVSWMLISKCAPIRHKRTEQMKGVLMHLLIPATRHPLCFISRGRLTQDDAQYQNTYYMYRQWVSKQADHSTARAHFTFSYSKANKYCRNFWALMSMNPLSDNWTNTGLHNSKAQAWWITYARSHKHIRTDPPVPMLTITRSL